MGAGQLKRHIFPYLALTLGLLTQLLFLLGGWLGVEQVGNEVQEGGSVLSYWTPLHIHGTICFHMCGLI